MLSVLAPIDGGVKMVVRAETLTIERLAGNIGAEILGIDTGADVDDETFAAIRTALLEHKVVFLRDQTLDYERQVAFASRFGELAIGHPIYTAPTSQPALRALDSEHGARANHWHTDLTFLERPPAFAFLLNKVAPAVGGDTMWANAVVGYESLPAELRDLANRLRIVHSNDCDYIQDTLTEHDRRDYIVRRLETEHPAVHVHPETGECALLVGGFAARVVGFTPQASRDTIRILQDYATLPEHTVRWRWRAGDLAIWDNRATLHYAIYDYGDVHRRVERVTVAGDVPIGVDGRPSLIVAGPRSGDGVAFS
jgi:alpha-ketoglutarate-dependent sulfate ester dioxygenase